LAARHDAPAGTRLLVLLVSASGSGVNQAQAVATCGREEGNSSMSATRPAARRLNLVTANSNLRAVTAEDRAWVSNARCRDSDPDELFVRGAAQRRAAAMCRHCPVMQECGAEALDNKVEYGIWGGMTERQRRALLKDHPEVMSWADFFKPQRPLRRIGT
jgi:WhiB family redox-sensing transcriptional regulator